MDVAEQVESGGELATGGRIDWRAFAGLVVAGLLAIVAGVPYQLELIMIPEVTWQVVLLNSLLANGLLLVVAILVGLKLSRPVGLALVRPGGSDERHQGYGLAVVLGVAAAVAVVVLDAAVFGPLVRGDLLQSPIESGASVPAWMGLLASLSAGVVEELLLRFGLMTLLVWVGWKLRREPNGSPTDAGVWLAIVLAAVLFGLGHLPLTSQYFELTPAVVGRAIVLNGLGGVVFGWLYWRRDLVAAMVAHVSADVVLLVVLPAIV